MSALPAPLRLNPLAAMHPAAQRDQWRYRWRHMEGLRNERLARELADRARVLDLTDYRVANTLTYSLAKRLKAAHVHHAFDEQELRDLAERRARQCERLRTLEQRAGFAEYCDVPPPILGRTITPEGAFKRLADSLWWRRALRKHWTRAAENGERELGIVRAGREPYASNDAVRRRAAQKRRWAEWLANHQVHSDDGAVIPLDVIAARSLANPALRRGELMARARGLEEIAQRLSHVALFITLTTPSRFHAELVGAGRNPSYDGSTVRDGQTWLFTIGARIRAELQRKAILHYGIRVAEPHHDGTPHWHYVVFARRRNVADVFEIFTRHALSDAGDEPGARDIRIVCEELDPKQGSAVGYLAKYISKNIDGKGAIGHEHSDEDPERRVGGPGGTIERVDAWASTHGIRQFAQLGTPPVSLYREARRLRDPVADPDIERARLCADRGSYGRFIDCIGGISAGRRANLRLERADLGERSRYGEARPPAVVGLRWASSVVITRPCRWRIERSPCSAAVPRTVIATGPRAEKTGGERGSAPGYNEPSGWTNPNETSQAGPL
jgi:Bacteriophage replication gene A protein (GPA)